MRVIYKKYLPDEEIPAVDYFSRRKLVKYFTRETMAAIVSIGELLNGTRPSSDTPFYFSGGETEMMDLYKEACMVFDSGVVKFDSSLFLEKALPVISPLSHFKMMRNMAHCFISIEYGLKGDNAAVMGSVSGLLVPAMLSSGDGEILIGAGKLHANGTAEAGFALVRAEELKNHSMLESDSEAICFFRENCNI
jgi:hypothetical protein